LLGRVSLVGAVVGCAGLMAVVGGAGVVCSTASVNCHLRPTPVWSLDSVAGDRGGAFRLAPALRSTLVADGFMYPTDFDFLADGRLVVATRAGVVRLVDHGRARRRPFLDLRGRVATWGARALVAIAVDRSARPPRLYVAYAVAPAVPASDEPTTVRFSRFTIRGDQADLDSEQIVAGRSSGGSCSSRPITADCIPADVVHIGADIILTDDGLMYLSTGDGGPRVGSDQLARRAQAHDSLAGKVLRVDRSGRGVRGNPYWDGDPNSNRSRIWASGFRNPFRLSLLPNGDLVAGDVGFNSYEELNIVERAGDYGWPCREGIAPTPEFRHSDYCTRYERSDASRRYGPSVPLAHGPQWHSITAGTALAEATRVPKLYRPMFVFADWMSSTLWALPTPDWRHRTLHSASKPRLIGAGLGGPVRLRVGPDGALYLLSINVGELRRIAANS
jgi:glucose/arabinose dehydrogenase